VVAANRARAVRRALEHGFRQVFGHDEIGGAEHDGAFDGVLEVPDVARPVVSFSDKRALRKALHGEFDGFTVGGNSAFLLGADGRQFPARDEGVGNFLQGIEGRLFILKPGLFPCGLGLVVLSVRRPPWKIGPLKLAPSARPPKCGW